MDVFGQLRRKFDGADSFVAGGHAVRGGGSTRHAERVANVPEWANDDVQVRLLLLSVFPKLATNDKQRERAGEWLAVIYMYFRQGLTRNRIAVRMGWTLSKVNNKIHAIQCAVKGKRADKPKLTKGITKKTGRPRKVHDTILATDAGSKETISF